MIKITYYEFKTKRKGSYKCECGKKFHRTETDFYTMNPFNKTPPKKCQKKCLDYVLKQLKEKECPECQAKCKPHKITEVF